MVTTSEVMISLTNFLESDFKNGLTSLLEIIPTIFSFSITGRPLTDSFSIMSWTVSMEDSGLIVTTSRTVMSSALLTFLTSSTCASWVMLRWITPTPPSWASAIAKLASVTVSIAALIIGMFNWMSLVKFTLVSTSFASIQEALGTNKKSS